MMPVALEILDLSGVSINPHNFTGGIPAEWSSMTNLKELYMAYCGLDGESVCSGMPRRGELRSESHTGLLPKMLPASLEELQLGPDYGFQDNNNKFEGGIPAEWGGLTKLKKLNLMKCGLDGESVSPDIPRVLPWYRAETN